MVHEGANSKKPSLDDLCIEAFHEAKIQRTAATENRLSKYIGRPLGLCGQRLPELNLIAIRVIDPGKATVGFIHSFGVDLYSLLF